MIMFTSSSSLIVRLIVFFFEFRFFLFGKFFLFVCFYWLKLPSFWLVLIAVLPVYQCLLEGMISLLVFCMTSLIPIEGKEMGVSYTNSW